MPDFRRPRVVFFDGTERKLGSEDACGARCTVIKFDANESERPPRKPERVYPLAKHIGARRTVFDIVVIEPFGHVARDIAGTVVPTAAVVDPLVWPPLCQTKGMGLEIPSVNRPILSHRRRARQFLCSTTSRMHWSPMKA